MSCVTAAGAGLALAACGGTQRQDASEPSGKFAVEVPTARFPTSQHLSQHSQLVIAVRNASNHTIPNIAVTITDPRLGTSAQAFASSKGQAGLASSSRPVWIVDQGPGPCQYSCQTGGPGGAVTAYANTWALGALAPGATATFSWLVTAVKPGTHEIHYLVAAGLNGKAKAVLSGGGAPEGTFTVTVQHTPARSYVDNNGRIVNQP